LAQAEREEVSPDTDYEAVQHRHIGVEMLRELPGMRILRCPIRLDATTTPQGFLVTADGFLHGTGDSLEAAIEDYAHALLDYYLMLQDEREALAPHLHRQLEQLEELIAGE
jgi:hypothetical protein